MIKITVPEPTLRRLPIYLQFLKNEQAKGVREISTTNFAEALVLDPTQVRKDLAYTDIVGKPKVGYIVQELIKAIEDYLNWNNLTDAFLAGAGNLGTAIVGYNQLKKYGINVVAAFDNDPYKINSTINEVRVLNIEKLTDLALRMHINIGIITVPAGVAQNICNMMLEGGITAIWNFAPVSLKVPQDIIVENASFSQSLAVLSRKLHERNKF